MVQRAPLAIAEYGREGEDALLAGRQQLLAGELGRGVEIKRVLGAVRIDERGAEGVQMGLIARRGLQNTRVDFDKALRLEPAADRGYDPPSRQQESAPIGMVLWVPPGTWQAFAPWRGPKRPLESASFTTHGEPAVVPGARGQALQFGRDRRW